MDPETEKAFQEAMKKASEKQYELTFNKSECLYEEIEQLEKPVVFEINEFCPNAVFLGSFPAPLLKTEVELLFCKSVPVSVQ